MTTLFTPGRAGALELRNRIVMAPMTRSRATTDRIPTELMVEYYRQRASAGLIVSEAIISSADGRGYTCVPGLYSEAQVQQWRPIVDAVHKEGGVIAAQLMHTGRISHASFLDGQDPLAPSAVGARGEIYTFEGMRPFPMPTAMSGRQIQDAIDGFRIAAVNARAAGFDAVEIHGASGYLVNQFLAPNANTRSDRWGGSIPNRARFLVEVVDAVASAIGADRLGLRLSPGFQFNDIDDPDVEATYTYVGTQMASRGLAYLHVMSLNPAVDALALLGACYPGVKIANGGFDKARAERTLADGRAGFISFGSLFLANPDLPERFARGASLAAPDPATFYTPGPKGYTDYARLA